MSKLFGCLRFTVIIKPEKCRHQNMLCECLRKQPPTPLDAPLERGGGCGLSDTTEETPNIKVLVYPLHGGKRPNFAFVPVDNGENYIAKFRATRAGEVMGRDSKPIPKAVFESILVIKERKKKISYCVDIDTGGIDLLPYIRIIDEETARKLDIKL